MDSLLLTINSNFLKYNDNAIIFIKEKKNKKTKQKKKKKIRRERERERERERNHKRANTSSWFFRMVTVTGHVVLKVGPTN